MAYILRQTTVVRDGMHNAFTDMAHWQGCYWISYRKGAAHSSPNACVSISVSDDRHRFYEAAHVRVPGDNRDPKLMPMGPDRMAAYFPSSMYLVDPERYDGEKRLHQYVAFSNDGFNWSEPTIVMTDRWLWRVRAHDGRYWGLTYGTKPGTKQSERIRTLELVVSDDMLAWETVAQIGDDGHDLGESDILFHDDGRAWVVSRSSTAPGHAWFSSAEPPYESWQTQPLDTVIHAPAILAHNGMAYVAGRRHTLNEDTDSYPFAAGDTNHILPSSLLSTPWSMAIWRLEHGRVEPVLHIPATGDCAYPGFIHDPDGRVCLSYYSQHAYHMGVVDQPRLTEASDPQQPWSHTPLPADVYFVEVSLD